MKHTISVLVENHFGVLARVSGLFSTRGYNIEGLCVGVTENPQVSRMTVVVHGDEAALGQVMRQLEKLVEVLEVIDLSERSFVARELVLIKVECAPAQRAEIIEIANIFRAKVVDLGTASLVLEVTGSEGKVNAFIDMIRHYGIAELVRTGTIAIERSGKQPVSA